MERENKVADVRIMQKEKVEKENKHNSISWSCFLEKYNFWMTELILQKI